MLRNRSNQRPCSDTMKLWFYSIYPNIMYKFSGFFDKCVIALHAQKRKLPSYISEMTAMLYISNDIVFPIVWMMPRHRKMLPTT